MTSAELNAETTHRYEERMGILLNGWPEEAFEEDEMAAFKRMAREDALNWRRQYLKDNAVILVDEKPL